VVLKVEPALRLEVEVLEPHHIELGGVFGVGVGAVFDDAAPFHDGVLPGERELAVPLR
jgi:hypothetical protein